MEPRLLSRLLASTATVALFMASPTSHAQAPEGATVAAGSIAVTQQGATTVVTQSSARGVIDWRSFSIGQNNAVRFEQPGASSVTLNRVTGGEISRLDGSLMANGQVWLSNPNGLIIGPGGLVNVGGLLATTGRIDAQSFLATGRAAIDGIARDAAIVNQGAITIAQGGYAALAAASIRNEGKIAARAGSVALGAGPAATIDFTGDRLIQFQVTEALDQPPAGGDAAIVNSGALAAEGGTVLLSARAAKGVMDNVINLRGLAVSNSVRVDGGTVTFGDGGATQVSGAIDVSSATDRGGTVAVLGESVALQAGAVINASGATGGGSVSIGGDWQGAGPNHNAQTAAVAAGAVIAADAIQGGRGGRIVVWADGATRVDGTLSAQGGQAFGDGGAIETSGKRILSIGRDAKISALAPRGRAGDWLLDPLNITVATGGGASLAAIADALDTTSSLTVDPATLAAAAANVTLAAVGSVTFVNALSMTNPGVSITVNADKTFINSAIGTNNGAFTIRNFAGSGQSSQVTFGATGAVNTGTATVDISAAAIGLQGNQTAGSFNLGAGAVTLTGATTLTAAGGAKINGALDGAFAFSVTGGTTSLLGGVGGATPLASLTLDKANLGGLIATNGTQSYAGAVKLSSNATFSTSNANVFFNGPLDAAAAGAQSLTAITGAGSTVLSGGVGGVGGVSALASLTVGAATVSGSIKTVGTQSYGGALIVANDSSLSTSNADVVFGGSVNAGTTVKDLTVVVGTGVAKLTGGVGGTTALATLTVDNAQLGGNITTVGAQSYGSAALIANTTMATSSGGIAFGAALNGPGAVALSAGANPVTMGDAVGATTPLASVTQTGSGVVTVKDLVRTVGAQSYASAIVITGNGEFSTTNSTLSFGGPIDANTAGGNPLKVDTGTGAISFGNNFGVANALASFTQVGTGTVSLGGDYKTTGSQVFTGGILLAPAVTTTIASTNGPLKIGTAGGTISSSGGTGSLTLSSGLGDLDAPGAITNLANLTLTATNATATLGSVSVSGAVDVAAFTGSNPGASTIAFTGSVNANNFITSATQLTIGFQQDATFAAPGNLTLSNLGGVITGVVGGAPTTVSNAGGLTINGPVVNDSAGSLYQTNGTPITFGSPLILTGSTVFDTTNGGLNLAGASISLAGLDSDAVLTPRSVAFRAGASGTISVSGAIGAVTPLSSLRVFSAAATKLDGSVVTIGVQRYAGPVVIGGNDVFSTTNANVIFGGPLDGAAAGAQSLSVNLGIGTVSLAGGVGANTPLASVSVSNAALGGWVTTTGAQSYGGVVNLMVGTTTLTTSSSAGDITLGAGASLNYAQVGAGTLRLLAGRDIILLAGSKIASTGATRDVTLNAGAIAATQSAVSGGVSITGGTIQTQGGSLAMVGGVSGALAASGSSALGGRGVYVSGGSVIDLVAGTLTVAGAGNSPLALANMTGVEFNASTVTATGGVVISGAGGANATSFGHGVALQGSTLTVTGGSVSITGSGGSGAGAATGLLIGGGSAISGADFTLSGNGGGGGSANHGVDVSSGTVTAAGAGTISVTGVRGGGSGSRNVYVGAAGVLSSASGDITVVGSSQINGVAFFNQGVSVDGTITTQSGTISLTGAGALGGGGGDGIGATGTIAATAAGGSVLLNGKSGAGGVGVSLSGATVATVNSDLIFQGDSLLASTSTVSTATGTIKLQPLNATDSIIVGLGGGSLSITTGFLANLVGPLEIGRTNLTGAITVAPGFVLTNDTTFRTNTGQVLFQGAIDTAAAAKSLTVAATNGLVSFAGAVGGSTPLAAVTVINAGPARLNADVTTTGTQSYGGALVLGNTVTLSTSNADIKITASLNGSTSNGQTLNVAIGTGTISRVGGVGGVTPLSSLSLPSTRLGGTVRTGGGQSYGDVTLQNNTTLSVTTGVVSFGAALDGPGGLTLATGAAPVQLATNVGATTRLAYLEYLGTGTVTVNGGVFTTGTQSYAGQVVVAGAGVFSTTNAAIAFASGFNAATAGGFGATLATGTGAVTLSGGAGGSTALASLSKTGAGSVRLGGNLTTTGALNFAGPVALANDVALNAGGSIGFGGAVDSAAGPARSLSVTAGSGSVTLLNSGAALNQINVNVSVDAAISGASGFTLASVTVGGTLSLTSSGLVTQTAALLAPNLAISGAGGNFQLTNAGNMIGVAAANTGSLNLVNGGGSALTIGAVGGLTGVTLSASGSIQQTGAQSLTVSAPASAAAGSLTLSSNGLILGGGLVTAANLTLSASGSGSTVTASYGAIAIATGTITVNGTVMMATAPTVATIGTVASVPTVGTVATVPTVATVATVASVPSVASVATQMSAASTATVPAAPSQPLSSAVELVFAQNSGGVLAQILTPPVNFSLGFDLVGAQANFTNSATSGALPPNAAAASAAVTSTLSGALVPLQPASVGTTGAPLAAARTIKIDAADTGGANGQVIAFGGGGATQVVLPGLLSVSQLRPPRYNPDDEVPLAQQPSQMNEEPLLD